jgi:hypothetical protein
MRHSFICGLAFLTLVVTGCGSAALVDRAGAEEATAVIARRDARANFFPLETGRFLGFAGSATAFQAPAVEYSMEIVRAAPEVGRGVVEIVDPETRSFVTSDNRGVRLVALAERPNGASRRLVRPMRLLTYPLRVGRIWSDTYGRGANCLHVRHWIADRLQVRTPEGTFDVYQIERKVWKGSYKPAYFADGTGRWTYYYASGVGPVQIGTSWPGITSQVYQLCSTRAEALTRAEAPAPAWRGLTAGLEPLVAQ